VIDGRQRAAVEPAVRACLQGEEAALHAGHPAVAVAGDAGQHLLALPAGKLAVGSAPAQQLAVGDVDPVQRLFGGDPDRAFTGGAAQVGDEFSFTGHCVSLCCCTRA